MKDSDSWANPQLTQQISGGTPEHAFLTSSQEVQKLLIQGAHLENHCMNV